MQFNQAGQYIVHRLKTELPSGLYYHDVNHTLDVYSAAERLGKSEGISGHDLQLLLTAAWYHDSGYLNGTIEHERESCKIAHDMLPGFGYSAGEVEQICTIIMATHLPQSPTNHLGEILADADLDYLGRDDFHPISEKLHKELCQAGARMTRDEWNLVQIKFLESHQYFTHTARADRQAKKEHNLHLIKADLK